MSTSNENARNLTQDAKAATGESPIERVKEKGAEIAEDLRETGREYINKARERGHDYAERAREEAEHLYEAGHRRAEEAAFYAELGYEEVSDIVRRNPVQALGVAAGVGFLLGLIVARR